MDNASGIMMRSNSTSTVTPWASNQLADLEGLAADRTSWRARCQQAVVNFEESRVVTLKINEGNARQAKSTHLLPLTFNVTCAEESAAPRSDCSPTDELIRDQRSVVSTAQSIRVLSKECNYGVSPGFSFTAELLVQIYDEFIIS